MSYSLIDYYSRLILLVKRVATTTHKAFKRMTRRSPPKSTTRKPTKTTRRRGNLEQKPTSTAPGKIARLSVSPSSVVLAPGEAVQLFATALDAKGNPIDVGQLIWTSLHPNRVVVSRSGMITRIASPPGKIPRPGGEITEFVKVTASISGLSATALVDLVGVRWNGRILFADGTPAPLATLRLTDPANPQCDDVTAESDALGRFHLKSKPKTWSAEVSYTAGQRASLAPYRASVVVDEHLELWESSEKDVILPTLTVTFVVLDSRGTKLPGAIVELRAHDASLVFQSDGTGKRTARAPRRCFEKAWLTVQGSDETRALPHGVDLTNAKPGDIVRIEVPIPY